jgi:3-hydroxyacyl-CoA dehydrogenase
MIARLERAVVLGAGTMGAQLAWLLAAAGVRVDLLDLDADLARAGLERVAAGRPSPVVDPADRARIRVDGFDALERAVEGADWILEAVVERLEAKVALFQRLDGVLAAAMERAAAPFVTTNTSGLSIEALAAGRSDGFRRRFFGSHFFNPPRYTRLLELVPGPATEPGLLDRLAEFGSRHLGKGVVRAKDRPAFIANRLGIHGLLLALELAEELGLGFDAVDELTGPLLGRPRSATFRTLDLVGLDVAVAVADHCYANLATDPERERFRVPDVLRRLVADGRLGEKTGAGFYRRRDGEILVLDPATYDYRPRQPLRSPSVEQARLAPDPAARLAALLAAARQRADDRPAAFVERFVLGSLAYAATVADEIADDVEAVDRAMRWGFGWELGPFELWERLGPATVVDALAAAGRPVPPLAEAALAAGGHFYLEDRVFAFGPRALVATEPRPGVLDLDARRRVVAGLPSNSAASLVDLGDGVLGLELHAKLNLIGLDTVEMLRRGAELAAERYDALVIGTRAADFSAGANLALLLVEAEDEAWDELEAAVRAFQAANRALRRAPIPVVALPRGRTLGGGAELCLAVDARVALRETYIGLVEVGVGLIPAGGGTTAMARRIAASAPDDSAADRFPFYRTALETLGRARVSASAAEARRLWLLGESDPVTADPDRQWLDGARQARTMAELGYTPPSDVPIAVVGRRGLAAAEALTHNELVAGRMSEYDRHVVLALARVLAGGDVAEGTLVSEDHLLDLECETFLRLLGEPRTQARIRHLLKTGKPLRN